MKENGTDPNLANELSEIFAWTVDFFGIQKGDSYKIIYEQLRVDGEVIGIGEVHSAILNHMGQIHYAFLFGIGDQSDYYDENGGSMMRTFLKAPLRFRRISSRFSYSRYHPVLKVRRPHTGVDYAASAGTPVYTVGDGMVIQKGWDSKGGGNFVKIKHNGTYTTVYMHLSGFARGLKTGQYVKQGDLIGYVGSTGLATGPHLDFRFYRNGKPIDPLKVKSPPAEPVDSTYLETFIKVRDIWMDALDTVEIKGKRLSQESSFTTKTQKH
jgi:murein DD-endopeptidase MepM/ murein hydrolase activator NlpD